MPATKSLIENRPAPKQGEWTYDDWLALPDDGNKYEVLDGVLYMTPAPTVEHQDSSGELGMLMRMYAKKNGLGKVLLAPLDVLLPTQPVPVQPDILFVHKNRLSIIEKKQVEGAPDLIVELLSPKSRRYDRTKKFDAYQSAGVQEYWIVDFRTRTIEVFLLEDGAYVLLGKYAEGEIASSRVLTGFSVAVRDVFEC